MRTTLDLDEDILQAAKELAALQKTTAGKVLSDLARKALAPRDTKLKVRNGVPLFPYRPGGRVMTVKMVKDLLDDE
jgi:hypothetical protein